MSFSHHEIHEPLKNPTSTSKYESLLEPANALGARLENRHLQGKLVQKSAGQRRVAPRERKGTQSLGWIGRIEPKSLATACSCRFPAESENCRWKKSKTPEPHKLRRSRGKGNALIKVPDLRFQV